ncbi:MAG: DUF4328 domain-containing protein [Phycisphaerae bacterium]
MRVECPHCGESYELDGKLIGREARCRGCRQVFTIEPAVEIEPPDEPQDAPAPPLPSDPGDRFRSPAFRGKLAIAAGVILLGAMGFSAYSSLLQLELLERLEQEAGAALAYADLGGDELEQRLRADGVWVPYEDVESNDRRELGAGMAHLAAFLVFFVLLLVWKYRAYKNLESLRAPVLRFSPAGAVAWYFCPIANLWKPCQAMHDIYVGSHPRGLGRNAEVGAGLVALWWGVWVLDWFVSYVSIRTYGDDMSYGGLSVATEADLACIVIGALSVILTIVVIRAVTRNQSHRAALLSEDADATLTGPENPYATLSS